MYNNYSKYYFGRFLAVGVILALFLHAGIFLYFLDIYINDDQQITPQSSKPALINISLVTEEISDQVEPDYQDNNTEQQPEPENIYIPPEQPINENKIDTDLTEKKQHKPQNTKKSNRTKSKYVRLIGKHIQSKTPELPDDLDFDSAVNLSLNLDQYGNLKNYSILSSHDQKLASFIDDILQMSSPFPKPPKEHLYMGEVTYTISLFPG